MDWKTVSARVKKFRAIRGWTQPELAAAMGKHRATVARIESGETCSESLLYLAAKALEIDVEKLTGEADPLKTHAIVSMSTGSGKTASVFTMVQDEGCLEAARDLCDAISEWEKILDSSVPLGEVLRVTLKAHRLREALKALGSEN